jgi:hypothetical protein
MSIDPKLLEILILAEEQVYLRTQDYPFQDQSERSHCWRVLGRIHDALIAAGVKVHNPVKETA